MSLFGGGLLWASDHGPIRRTVENLLGDQMLVYLPSTVPCPAAGCGYNTFTRSAIDAACLTCNGVGLVTTWHQAVLSARAVWVDAALLHPHQGLVAGEIGEAQVQGRIEDRYLYERVRDVEGAYILFDGQRIKPHSVTLNQVEGYTSLDVRCNIVSEAKP